MNDNNIAFRLKFLIENLGITSSQFADECNISRPSLSQLLTGRNKKVSDILIGQIHNAYPRLSVLWLLFGEGDMWNDNASVVNNSSIPNGTSNGTPSDSSAENNRPDEQTSCDINKSASKNTSDKQESPISGQDRIKYSNLTPLNYQESTIKSHNNQELETIIKNADLISDLAKKNQKCRKVVQITIYYDDSTFETFHPGN